jgi:hypothetical protein
MMADQSNAARIWALLRVRVRTMGFGPKEGAWDLLAMLPTVEDFPNPEQWRITSQRASRTGSGRPVTEEMRRARAAGSISVLRTFRNEQKALTFWMSLTPYATTADAQAKLRTIPESLLVKPFWKVLEHTEDSAPPLVAERSLRYRETVRGPRGRVATTTIVAGTVGELVFVMDFSAARSSSWSTVDIDSMSVAQVLRLRDLADKSE